MSVLGRVIAASEALEVGDVELARAILHDLERDIVGGMPTRWCRCECGQLFEWPGLLEAHRFHCNSRRAA
jgi:hypothetical protein